MATHHFQPSHHTTIGPHQPVLRIADGDTVITSTVDAIGKDARDNPVTPRGNPQDRAVLYNIEGVELDDTLVVRFDRIFPNRPIGYTASISIVAANVVDPAYARKLPERELFESRIDSQSGTATLLTPSLGNPEPLKSKRTKSTTALRRKRLDERRGAARSYKRGSLIPRPSDALAFWRRYSA
jgi:amidase